MVTPRQAYLASKLVEKYGVIGRVASRYLTAGYSVRILHPTRYGPVHVVALKHGTTLAIDIATGSVSVEIAKNILEKSKLLRAKPILVIYGRSVVVPEDVKTFCDENGIKLRRILGE